jgi:hypothetical protein
MGLGALAARAGAAGDWITAEVLHSLRSDVTWHRACTRAFVQLALRQHPSNRDVLERWVADWSARAGRALPPAARSLNADPTALQAQVHAFQASCELRPPS